MGVIERQSPNFKLIYKILPSPKGSLSPLTLLIAIRRCQEENILISLNLLPLKV